MSVEYFIDTNLFIYQLEAMEERKAATAERIISKGIRPATLASASRSCRRPEYRAPQGRDSTQYGTRRNNTWTTF